MHELHHGDCLEVMATMDAESMDTIITDPPYNAINRETGGLRQIDKGLADSSPIDIDALADEFNRLATGSIYVWCSDEQFTDWTLALKSRGFTTRIGAWWKTNPSPMNGQHLWLSALELCVFACKPKAYFANRCAHPVWRGAVARRNGHPTPKPEWLMAKLTTASVPTGGVVLDPFMGSGTTGVAALMEGRNFIGIEKEAEYMEIARKRIEHAAMQPSLFDQEDI